MCIVHALFYSFCTRALVTFCALWCCRGHLTIGEVCDCECVRACACMRVFVCVGWLFINKPHLNGVNGG